MEQTPNPPYPPKKSIKPKLVAFATLIILGCVGYGYYWYTDTARQRARAAQIIGEYRRVQSMGDAVANERARCDAFIGQSAGNFAEFEYCKKFIEWTNSILVQ